MKGSVGNGLEAQAPEFDTQTHKKVWMYWNIPLIVPVGTGKHPWKSVASKNSQTDELWVL